MATADDDDSMLDDLSIGIPDSEDNQDNSGEDLEYEEKSREATEKDQKDDDIGSGDYDNSAGANDGEVVSVEEESGSKIEQELKKYELCLNSKKRGSRFKFVEENKFSEKCELCNETFTSKYTFMTHDSCYEQRLADKRSRKKLQSKKQSKNRYSRRRNFECLVCDKSFKNRRLLGNHARYHFKPQFECRLCNFAVKKEKSLAMNHETKHVENYEELKKMVNQSQNGKTDSLKRKRTSDARSESGIGSSGGSSSRAEVESDVITLSDEEDEIGKINKRNKKRKEIKTTPKATASSKANNPPAAPIKNVFNKECEFCHRQFSCLPLFILHEPCYNIKLHGKGKPLRLEETDQWECLDCAAKYQRRFELERHLYRHYEQYN